MLLQWSCSVPLILRTPYIENYAHTLGNTAGWLYDRLVVSASEQLAARAVVAIDTPWSVGLPSYARTLLQPLARQPITTLAE